MLQVKNRSIWETPSKSFIQRWTTFTDCDIPGLERKNLSIWDMIIVRWLVKSGGSTSQKFSTTEWLPATMGFVTQSNN